MWPNEENAGWAGVVLGVVLDFATPPNEKPVEVLVSLPNVKLGVLLVEALVGLVVCG